MQRSKDWKAFHRLVLTPDENARREAKKKLIGEVIASLGIMDSRNRRLPEASRNPRRKSTGNATSRQAATPLSRQPPIASLLTPGSSDRVAAVSAKRRSIVVDESSEDEIRLAPARQRRRVHKDPIDQPQVSLDEIVMDTVYF